MSFFPYNTVLDKDGEEHHPGTPIDFDRLQRLADEARHWHFDLATDTWSQSGSQHRAEVNLIALGLATILADASHLHALMAIGEQTKRRLESLVLLADDEQRGKGPNYAFVNEEAKERRLRLDRERVEGVNASGTLAAIEGVETLRRHRNPPSPT